MHLQRIWSRRETIEFQLKILPRRTSKRVLHRRFNESHFRAARLSAAARTETQSLSSSSKVKAVEGRKGREERRREGEGEGFLEATESFWSCTLATGLR